MQVHEFQEADRKKLIFVFGLAVVVAVGVPMVAFGLDRMAELVDSSSTKWAAVEQIGKIVAFFRGFLSLDPTDVSRKGKTGTYKVVEFRVKGPAV